MTSGFVDFHCHLDLYPDHEAAFVEREREEVYTVAVTTTPKAWPRNRDLASGKCFIRAALGIHPQLISSREDDFPIWEKYLHEARFVGEVGLDAGTRFYKSLEQQKLVFSRVLRACAEQGNKILSVHSVRAATAVLDLVEKNLPPSRGTVVLHWFTGTNSEAKRASQMGCYFSINREMFRTSHRQKMIAELPLNRILTESDAPFIRVPPQGTHSDILQETVDLLARVRKSESQEIVRIVKSNASHVLDEPYSGPE
jgi:TatD DNase family protein